MPATLRAALTTRIKIMAKLDIAERRLPQDGRIKTAVRGVEIDIRVSTLPTVFGESIVMRILDRTRVELDFTKLGLEPATQAKPASPDDAAERNHPGHRPDRQRQDDDALHRAEGSQPARTETVHGGRPDRVPAFRDQPDPGTAADRPRLSRPRCARSCARTRTSS